MRKVEKRGSRRFVGLLWFHVFRSPFRLEVIFFWFDLISFAFQCGCTAPSFPHRPPFFSISSSISPFALFEGDQAKEGEGGARVHEGGTKDGKLTGGLQI